MVLQLRHQYVLFWTPSLPSASGNSPCAEDKRGLQKILGRVFRPLRKQDIPSIVLGICNGKALACCVWRISGMSHSSGAGKNREIGLGVFASTFANIQPYLQFYKLVAIIAHCLQIKNPQLKSCFVRAGLQARCC